MFLCTAYTAGSVFSQKIDFEVLSNLNRASLSNEKLGETIHFYSAKQDGLMLLTNHRRDSHESPDGLAILCAPELDKDYLIGVKQYWNNMI